MTETESEVGSTQPAATGADTDPPPPVVDGAVDGVVEEVEALPDGPGEPVSPGALGAGPVDAAPEMATGDEPLAAEPAQAREPDAPPAAAGPGDGIMALTEGLERLTVKVEELGRLGQRDADLVDRLHAENQKLRAGELTQAMAPFVRDVMRVHDDIVRLERGNDEADPASGDLSLVRRQLLGVLSRAGLERFDIAGGTAFDPSRHQGVGVVDTQDADADAVVAAMIRCGFAWADGRVLRPAEVTVQRFRPAETTST